ncbi:YwqJ-related putative deaminase, partial [Enterobacter asburiae]
NNPVTLYDDDGRKPLEWLDLEHSSESRNVVEAIYKQNQHPGPHYRVQDFYEKFTQSTKTILQETSANESILKEIPQGKREKKSKNMKFTNAKLKGFAAHAGVINTLPSDVIYKDEFLNLPGSLSKKNLFPGVEIISENVRPGFESYHPDTLKKSKKWRPEISLGYYKVVGLEAFISEIGKQYKTSGTELHPVTESRIRAHVKKNKSILPNMAGIAGLHAEVQALNYIISHSTKGVSQTLNNSYIYTQRLVGAQGEDFPACYNCSGIISGLENVMTGRVRNHTKLQRRKSFSL